MDGSSEATKSDSLCHFQVVDQASADDVPVHLQDQAEPVFLRQAWFALGLLVLLSGLGLVSLVVAGSYRSPLQGRVVMILRSVDWNQGRLRLLLLLLLGFGVDVVGQGFREDEESVADPNHGLPDSLDLAPVVLQTPGRGPTSLRRVHTDGAAAVGRGSGEDRELLRSGGCGEDRAGRFSELGQPPRGRGTSNTSQHGSGLGRRVCWVGSESSDFEISGGRGGRGGEGHERTGAERGQSAFSIFLSFAMLRVCPEVRRMSLPGELVLRDGLSG